MVQLKLVFIPLCLTIINNNIEKGWLINSVKDQLTDYVWQLTKALVMLKEYRNEIEILKPLFNLVDTLIFDNNPLQEARYFVMGQICVDKATLQFLH